MRPWPRPERDSKLPPAVNGRPPRVGPGYSRRYEFFAIFRKVFAILVLAGAAVNCWGKFREYGKKKKTQENRKKRLTSGLLTIQIDPSHVALTFGEWLFCATRRTCIMTKILNVLWCVPILIFAQIVHAQDEINPV